MCASQVCCQFSVVLAKLREHILGSNKLLVIVGNALKPGDVAYRMQCRPADLHDALRDEISRRKYLLALLIEQQMVVSEVRSRYMPMEVLRLDVKGEQVG